MNNKELEIYMNLYKDKSIEIIQALDDNQIEILNIKFGEREELINKINDLSFDKSYFQTICNELEIVKFDELIKIKLQEASNSIKKDISNLKKAHSISKLYKQNNKNYEKIFNKKV